MPPPHKSPHTTHETVRMGGVRSDPRMGGGAGQGGGWGGYPSPPGQMLGRGQGWGAGQVPLPHPPRSDPRTGGTPYWNSIACTCYMAGSMPLAFLQEDFLVDFVFV